MRELSEQVRRAVASGEFSPVPFPYLFATDVLPSDFYEQISAAWPSFDQMGKASPTIGRIDFPLAEFENPNPMIDGIGLSDQHLRAWDTFRDLIEGSFFEAAFPKFQPYLRELGRDLLAPPSLDEKRKFSFRRPDLSFWKRAVTSDFVVRNSFLTNRKDLSVLSPHIDPIYFSFTLIFYFAPGRDHQHLGTRLFKQSAPGRARLPSEIENFDAQYAVHYSIPCEQVRALPFLPNSALLFLNGLHSWHGQHLDEAIERKTYNSFFVVKTELLPKAMRAPDIVRLRETKMVQ